MNWLAVQSGEADIYRKTGCLPFCSRNSFRTRLLSSSKSKVKENGTGSSFKVNLFFASGTFAEKTQYLSYSFSDLVSDFGGYLGLLLGHSVMSIYDAVLKRFETCRCC